MTLGDVLEIRNGRNQKIVEDPDGKYPIYGSGGIMGYANDYICEADTVIVGRKGSINNPIFVEEPFWNVDTAFGLSAKREVLLPRYLYYFCRHFDFRRLNKAVTIPSLTKSDLLKIEIELPPMEIQRKVVDKLSEIERIIQMRKQELQRLDELIKVRFVEMFGDPVSDSMNWGKSTLFEICDKLTDGTHFSPKSYKTGEFMYITAKNIKHDGFDFTDLTYVNADVHKEIYSRCNPEFGDVLYIKDGVTTGIAIVNTLHEQFTMLSSVALLKYNRRLVSGRYLCAALNNDKMYNAVRGNMGGAAITRLTITKLNKIAIPIPPLELQQQFSAFAAQVNKSKLYEIKF